MVQDVYSKADVLNTSRSCGAPNFRQVKGSYPLYGMGQPGLNGFKQVLQWLQAQGHEVSDTVVHLNRSNRARISCRLALIPSSSFLSVAALPAVFPAI